MTLGYTIIGELFGLERRAKLQGWISSVWGVASLVGPWLGGVLSDHVSWRWGFYVNLPFGGIAMALIATALVEGAPPPRPPVLDVAGGGPLPPRGVPAPPRPLGAGGGP